MLNSHKHLATFCMLMLFVHTATAQVPCGGYEVTAIIQVDECPPFGYPGMVPDGMNDLGWVVGHFNACVIGPDVSWLWTPENGLELLDMPPDISQSRAIDINNHPDRQIVGTVDISDVGTRAFLIDGEDLIIIPPPNGGTFSSVAALNNQRQIVGNTSDGTPYSKAYIWEEGVMTIIKPTFGPGSAARDINEAGVVVGWMGNGIGIDSHAFVRQNGTIQDIGPIPGGISGAAKSINAQIQITVDGTYKDDHPKGFISGSFLWENGKWTDLGMLDGYDSMAVKGLNNDGAIVGSSRAIESSELPDIGFVWQNRVLKNINDLIDPDAGLVIVRAVAINELGQILVQATDLKMNATVAAILTPFERPLGDLNGDCVVSTDDLLILLTSWGPCDDCANCPADINADCVVSTIDLLILFSNWG